MVDDPARQEALRTYNAAHPDAPLTKIGDTMEALHQLLWVIGQKRLLDDAERDLVQADAPEHGLS